VVIYTAQNIDKRFPPPFAQCERAAYRRVTAMYPCSSQAAAVARGKGFSGLIEVLPLGYDDTLFVSGSQSLDADELVIGLVGRLVPEKGVLDAVQVLAMLQTHRPTRLILAGSGPELDLAQKLSARLGVAERLEIRPWQSTSDLAELYRSSHVLLIPSRPTLTWAEQFGRVIVEAQASGAVVAGYASGSIPEVAGDAGLLVPCGAITRLGACIAELIGDPDEFARRRDLGIAQSRERTWTSVGARQAELYRAIIAGDAPSTDLPRSPRARRQFARDQFGPTASALAGQRPFALPVLRRGGRGATGLAQCIDGLGELAARFPRHLGQRDGCRSTATR
jgi:glycosyltransferase involved in cell wall biosynthesis